MFSQYAPYLKVCSALQDCRSLPLTSPDGTRYDFCGIRKVLEGTISADCALTPPDRAGDESQALKPPQLANQLALQARALLREYHDSWLVAKDDPQGTPAARHKPAAGSWLQSLGTTSRAMTERQLYLEVRQPCRSSTSRVSC